MPRKPAKKHIPSHHLIVERSEWYRVFEARRDGVPWDELRTRIGLSALGMAIFEGSALATQAMLEIGAPIASEHLYNGDFFSPLWSALEKQQPAILDLLLQAGADPNEAHAEYGTPLLYASQMGLDQETIVLCKHGAIPNTDTAPSPLWLWIKHLQPEKDESGEWRSPDVQPVLALLKNGARIHVDDDQEDAHATNIGLNEIDFAKRQWLKYPLRHQDLQNIQTALALMERNLYGHAMAAINNIKPDTHNPHKM